MLCLLLWFLWEERKMDNNVGTSKAKHFQSNTHISGYFPHQLSASFLPLPLSAWFMTKCETLCSRKNLFSLMVEFYWSQSVRVCYLGAPVHANRDKSHVCRTLKTNILCLCLDPLKIRQLLWRRCKFWCYMFTIQRPVSLSDLKIKRLLFLKAWSTMCVT